MIRKNIFTRFELFVRPVTKISFQCILLLLVFHGRVYGNDREALNAIEARVERFCGDCHALPRAESFEAKDWYAKVQKGFEIYAQSGRQDLVTPSMSDVVDYYRKRAPTQLEFQDLGPVDESWKARFSQSKMDWRESSGYVLPAISSIQWIDLIGEPRLVVCDMRDGTVNLIHPKKSGSTRSVLARLGNPARVTLTEIGGKNGLLVADLGSFAPFDHAFGKVYSLARKSEGLDFQSEVLVENCGRIADVAVRGAGINGPKSIVFAEFGHRDQGGILSSLAAPSSRIQRSDCKVLDLRPGCLRIIPFDWDKDGALDYAALFSQQYETVELFLNRGVNFERRVLWKAPDMSFGGADLELCDLNQDGAMDLLLTNGDSFDNNYANASHGVQWLENRGSLRFDYHRIVSLPGACRSRVGDVDSDGDLDVITVAHLPSTVEPLSLRNSNPVSVLLLEQTAPSVFTPRVLSRNSPKHPSVELADFDGNGKLDIAIGSLVFQSSDSDSIPRLTIWWQD
jgi:hypothetical protein